MGKGGEGEGYKWSKQSVQGVGVRRKENKKRPETVREKMVAFRCNVVK